MRDEIVVVPYDAQWPVAFETERARVASLLAPHAIAIAHIGSTAVPGLAAKPVIDVLAGLAVFAEASTLIAGLVAGGWDFPMAINESLDGRAFYKRVDSFGIRTHHLHLVAHDGPLWRGYVSFRDALRASAALASQYEVLKRSLAARYRDDREAYTAAKTSFVESVLGHAPPSDRRIK